MSIQNRFAFKHKVTLLLFLCLPGFSLILVIVCGWVGRDEVFGGPRFWKPGHVFLRCFILIPFRRPAVEKGARVTGGTRSWMMALLGLRAELEADGAEVSRWNKVTVVWGAAEHMVSFKLLLTWQHVTFSKDVIEWKLLTQNWINTLHIFYNI